MKTIPLSRSRHLLETARRSRRFLTEEAQSSLRSYLLGQVGPDGGFRGRSEASDLYYTVFGVDSLLALEPDPPPQGFTDPLARYVRGFKDREGLDLVHLSCLGRCLSRVETLAPDEAETLLRQVESYRSKTGGYRLAGQEPEDTLYGTFMAFMTYQDLNVPVPDPVRLVQSVQRHRSRDAGYANELDATSGATPATAAAVSILEALGQPLGVPVGDWLMARWCPEGGFSVLPGLCSADLLSTATSLYSLLLLNRPLAGIRESCLRFVETLWVPEAGFLGHPEDSLCDVEFTFYGLLALGCLLSPQG